MTTVVVGVVGSMRGYAKHRKALGLNGGSLAAVQKAIKSGRIQLVDGGKIDFDQADKSWEANSDHRQQRISKAEAPAVKPVNPEVADTFLEAQKRHEWLKVQKAELELALRREELLERDQVKDEVSKMLSMFKNKMLYIPSRISQRLGSITDDRERRAIIDHEIKEALSVLSEYEPDA
jgi:hypothetical protein